MNYLFIILLSFNLYAQDENCVPIAHSALSNNINKLLEWFGAVDNQVEKAPCKVKAVPTEAEMLKFIAGKSKGSTTDSVYGVKFNNESPELIKAFSDFTTAKDSFGMYNLIPYQKNIQGEYKIPSSCDKVLCAMEKIWGREYSIKLLYTKLKHNYNSSELAFENSDRFTPAEFDDVILGLEDLPPHLTPLGMHNQRLTHFKRGYTLKQYEGTVLANAVVMLFDGWDKKSSLTKQYTVFHEMSHNVSSKFKDMDESPDWLKLSGWVKKGDDWTASATACSVSRYGQTNPWEDFAETLSSFRYNGAQLKSKCPEKFEFVKKNVFRGIDYTEVKNCTTVPMEKIQLAQKSIIDEIMNSVGTTPVSEEELKNSCPKGFSAYPIPDKELALCSLKVHSEKALSGSNTKVSEALQKAGILDSAANRDLVLSGISESFTDEMMTDITLRSITVTDKVEQMLQDSFTAANPEDFSKKNIAANDYRFTSTLKECGIGFFTGELDVVKQCQLRAMINQDRDMQKWNLGIFPTYTAPSVFFNDAPGLMEKREQVLFEHLVKQPMADDAISLGKKKYLEDMKYHLTSVQVKLYKLPNWKKMSPEEFCKESYGGGTSWTEQYGVAAGSPIPKLFDACVKEQSKRNKRFEIKEEDWMKLVSE